jgi:hypothetical protein
LKPFGDHEILGRAAVGLLNEFQCLEQRDLDVFLLDQRRERLGGEFLEVREAERAFAFGEGGGDLNGIRGFEGGDGGGRKRCQPPNLGNLEIAWFWWLAPFSFSVAN